MKKLLMAVVLAAGAMAFAGETKYVDPNPFADYGPATKSTERDPLAVCWSRAHDAALETATTDEALAAVVADAASAEALLKKVKGAYASDPVVLTQVAAVTQWTMLSDPWYCLFWDGPHAAGRAVWTEALLKTIAGAEDEYVRTVCRQQLALCSDCSAETVEQAEGFEPLFDGRTLAGWKPQGGSATYAVQDGTIVGLGVPGTPGNTFLCTEKTYENFIFRGEFKCASGNSGIQFRSSTRPDRNLKNGTCVYGYQSEITPGGDSCGRIYDEGRRGFKHGIVWLDNTPKVRQELARRAFRPGDWNTVEIQCVGPSLKTWINGVKVSDVLDDCQQRGFFGLQIHAQAKAGKDGKPTVPGTCAWRNLRVRELPACPAWKKFFVKGADGRMSVDGAKYVIPQDWTFVTEKGETYLRGVHDEKEHKDGLVISHADYANFMARVTYKLNGGNSALYFRAAEEDIPWVLKGFQNEIAGNAKDSALWHTQGKTTKGRGWVASNDELVKKVRDAKGGWNTVATIAVGNRLVNRINGFETFDIVDPLCEKTGKLGLQLHGGCKNEVRFKDWEVMPVADWMLPYIAR